MTSPSTVVRAQQVRWAASCGIVADSDGYTLTVADNLFAPLSIDARREFEKGDGDELGSAGRRAKMQALHSSSALACNVFEYWRGRDAGPLAKALRLSFDIAEMRYEQKRPTGLRGRAPNLDVVLTLSDGSEVAVESKFIEPYGSRHAGGLGASYFGTSPGLWARDGCEHCQRLAEDLEAGTASFRWLNTVQLLKHVVGLARHRVPWMLLYLWYGVDDPASVEHGDEAARFAVVAARDGIRFRALTYQEVYRVMAAEGRNADPRYLAYLEGRYFAGSSRLASPSRDADRVDR